VDSFHFSHDLTATGANAQDDWHNSQGVSASTGQRLEICCRCRVTSIRARKISSLPCRGLSVAICSRAGTTRWRWFGAANPIILRLCGVLAPGPQATISTPTILKFSTAFPGERASASCGEVACESRRTGSDGPLQHPRAAVYPGESHPESCRYLRPGQYFADREPQSGSRSEARGRPVHGVEPLPSARLSWKVTDSHLLWLAVSAPCARLAHRPRSCRSHRSGGGHPGGDFQPEKLLAMSLATADSRAERRDFDRDVLQRVPRSAKHRVFAGRRFRRCSPIA